jgi:hypothetical protein
MTKKKDRMEEGVMGGRKEGRKGKGREDRRKKGKMTYLGERPPSCISRPGREGKGREERKEKEGRAGRGRR